MSKLIDAAKRLSSAYTEDATPEELLMRMEALEQEQMQKENEYYDCEEYCPNGHISPQLAEAMDQYFEELCLEVKHEYGTDLHKVYLEV